MGIYDTMLSKNFALSEFTKSDTAKTRNIDNTPSSKQVQWLTEFAVNMLQPIRDKYGKPMKITSGYRCPKLNAVVGGVKTSSHACNDREAAVDITTGSRKENKVLYNLIVSMVKNHEITIDQVIYEKGNNIGPDWVHIGGKFQGRTNRNQVLRIY